MIYVKGNKRDYDHWAELGNDGWNWNTVKKYFKKLENMHGLEESEQYGRDGLFDLTKYDSGHPIKYAAIEAYKLLGYPHLNEENPLNPTGTLEANMCIQNGQRVNVAKAFLGKIKERKNLFISLNSSVQKIIIDAETKTTMGVLIKIGGKILILKAKKEVIVSGGTINSPKLLMLSGLGPKKHLEDLEINLIKDLPVGENLEDHMIFIGFDVALGSDAMAMDHPLDALYDYFMHRTGKFATIDMTNTLAFINTKNDSAYPNFGFHHFLYPQNDPYLLPNYARVSGLNDEVLQSKLRVTQNGPGLMFFHTLLNPKSKGKILLKNKNSDEHPLIYSGYLTDENGEDMKVMLEGIRFAEKLIQTSPMKKFKPNLIKHDLPACETFEFQSDEYWMCALRHLSYSVYHPTGTCRMGPKDDGTAVVDSRLRVHGVKNLRVADASIMPKIVSANTAAPSMMIGYKAAIMIREDWEEYHDEL